MFDWVLKASLNIVTIFFLDVSKFKLMTLIFLLFFCFNFSYQYAPEVKVYLKPSQISALELFRKVFVFEKTLVAESLGFYSVTLLKERTPIQMFSHDFCKILKTSFLENTSRRLLLFYENRFYQ